VKTSWLLAVALLAPRLAAEESKEAARYALDTIRSTMTWELPATLHTVHGKVAELSGLIEITPDIEGSGIGVAARVTVRAASMTTGNESRDKTMREKILETDRFPEIVFELEKVDGDLARLAASTPFDAKVSGRLTIHGKTLPLDVLVSVAPASDAVTLSGSFPLLWKAYGLRDPSFGIVTVREPMKVVFVLRATPELPAPK
jgi:polyisoprenoid-binding protein YceI